MYKLDESKINEFKEPFGPLYPDFKDAIPAIKSANFLISVGDETTKNLVENDIIPLNAVNPAGTLTSNLWETIESAINSTIEDEENRIIVVEGEEDLAVLPCLLMAPEDGVILYGQPNEGLVFVNVMDAKDLAIKLLTYFNEA